MASNFYSTLATAKLSEALVADFLSNRGWIVTDVSNDPNYQLQDIDIIIEQGDCRRTIEIKRDNCIAKTGNLILETITNARRHTKGWFEITTAEYLFVHDTKNNVLLVAAISHLNQFIDEHRKLAQYKFFKSWEGYGYKQSEAWLIPWCEYKKYYPTWEYALGGN